MIVSRFARWLDDQLGLARLGRRDFLRKIFPDHWSFMLGEVALYSFIVLLVSGTFLVFFFRASSGVTTSYQGSYAPLRGVPMSHAFESVLRLSFDVRAGLWMRQIHHWAAVVFVGAIALHMLRVFFTGGFRRPRQLNWLVGATLLTLAVFSGFTGYSIVDDLLSGTGLVIGYSVLLSVPVVGAWLSSFLFGGPVPNPSVVPRLYSIHVMVLPGLLILLLTMHLVIIWRQKHTNYPGPNRSNRSIVGTRLWPTYASKATGYFLIVTSFIAALGALVQINPIWIYGPYDPAAVTSAAQPDWYLGWLEGALRLIPAASLRIGPYFIPNVFFSGGLVALIILGGLYLWPFLEAAVTHDHDVHHVLDRPRDNAVRTAIGAAGVTFLIMLLLAGSDDVIAILFGQDITNVINILRVLTLVLPLAAGVVAFFVCRWLSGRTPPVEVETQTAVEHAD